ncbi:MAG: phosphatase PAP2 family protein [Burkholderiales bacterium]|nr:phosphatase PAP2 family protein [Burkholderiales bacterium]MDE2395174.1 phosphatase PAP2 family protein [Burkholderiales bacterium]MDE2455314.1 phosphatase PAP2 family protein [Burkholderiales bacterium]
MEALDRSLFLALNADISSPPWLLDAARWLAADLVYLVPLLLTALWLWGSRVDRRAALTAFTSALLALALGQAIGWVWPHPRPFMVGLGLAFAQHAADPSFPSDHATVFFALGLALLGSPRRALGSIVLLLGALVGWARVFLGVHFPFDIAGALPVAWTGVALARALLSRSHLGARLTDTVEACRCRVLALPIAQGWVRA